jgi:hypothetical protein
MPTLLRIFAWLAFTPWGRVTAEAIAWGIEKGFDVIRRKRRSKP